MADGHGRREDSIWGCAESVRFLSRERGGRKVWNCEQRRGARQRALYFQSDDGQGGATAGDGERHKSKDGRDRRGPVLFYFSSAFLLSDPLFCGQSNCFFRGGRCARAKWDAERGSTKARGERRRRVE